jgi:hypothetical protein
MERISEESVSVSAVCGAVGAVEFIQAVFGSPDNVEIKFGVGFSQKQQKWAVIASCGEATCALDVNDARKAAGILEKGIALFPNFAYRGTVEQMIESFRTCADTVEQMTSGVRQ